MPIVAHMHRRDAADLAAVAIRKIADDYSYGKPGSEDFIRVTCEAIQLPTPAVDDLHVLAEALHEASSWLSPDDRGLALLIFGLLDAHYGPCTPGSVA